MRRWYSYSTYLENRFGKRVFRIGVDGGFSCPNREKDKSGGCAFCDVAGAVAVYQRKGEGGFTHKSAVEESLSGRAPLILSLKDQIEKGREFLASRYKAEGFSLYFQSFTNTYAPLEKLKRIYDEGLSYGPFDEFIVSTRPDVLPDDVIDLLASYRSDKMDVWVELGLQSANDRTLERINRGHSVDSYVDAVERLKKRSILVSTHVILGLPGEGREDWVRTSRLVSDLSSDAVKIHNLQILLGTRMEEKYRKGLVKVLDEEEYLDALILFLRNLSSKVIVGRLIGESPMHRLVAPRSFPDKSKFLSHLEKRMEEENCFQGDLYDA